MGIRLLQEKSPRRNSRQPLGNAQGFSNALQGNLGMRPGKVQQRVPHNVPMNAPIAVR
jgi:hypothetical protein